MTVLWIGTIIYPFSDEETEAHSSEVTCPRSHRQEVTTPETNPGNLAQSTG